MKTCLFLFCFVSGYAATYASPSTTEFDQDKPDRLYVDSDTLFVDSYSDSLTTDSDGATVDGQLWHHYDHHWQDQVGGAGTRQDTQQSDTLDSEGHGWSVTNSTSSVLTWQADGNGTERYTASDGSTVTYPISLPLITSEHCWVNDPKRPPFTFQDLGDGSWAINESLEEYVRHAQTRWRLQTGGRSSQSSVFRFTAAAKQILDKRAERPFHNAKSKPVPPQDIAVLGQRLYPDTNLWMVLPNGTNFDVTPFVDGVDFYRMDVYEQKYSASITVNDLDLRADTPEFCAGEHLTFNLVFDPPPEFVNQISLWELPGSPVNESWRESA